MIVRSSLAGLLATAVVGLVTANVGCSLVVERDLKAGVGATCTSNDQCQGEGAQCTFGMCTTGCETNADCPLGSVCGGAEKRCVTPLKIGALFIGNSAEGWTKTHGDGLAEVSTELGFPEVTVAESVTPGPGPEGAIAKVEQFIAEGNQVIVATSTSYNADIVPLAAKYPDVKFLVCEGSGVTQNLGSYYGRREQAWYLAGQIAARKSAHVGDGRPDDKNLGIVGSFVSPDTVRNINAFLLGARSEKPNIEVEVRWSGFWFDYSNGATFSDGTVEDKDGSGFCTSNAPCFLEEYLTDKLVAGGADVVTHQTDVDRTVTFVEKYNRALPAGRTPVWSIANNNRYGCRATGNATGSVLPACLSAVYWNWTPLYRSLFSDMRFNRWTPSDIYENLINDPARTIVGVEVGEAGATAIDGKTFSDAIAEIADQAAKGNPHHIFFRRGPYPAIERADGDMVGAPLTDDQVNTMCWFAKGVTERRDPECFADPRSCKAADARVPRGDYVPPKALPPFGETGAAAFDCTKHGGK